MKSSTTFKEAAVLVLKERGLHEQLLVVSRALPAPTKNNEAAAKQQKLL